MLKEETYLLRHRISQKLKRVRGSAHSRTTLSLTTYSILPVFLFNFGGVSATPQIVSNPDYKPSLIQPVAKIAPLAPVAIPPAPSPVQPPAVPPPAPPPAPAPVGSCVTGVTMSDYYANLVMQRESGGNSCAQNPSGACGLFQALPCSKMGCSLYDVACQEQWGLSYIASAYGSSAAAWSHEISYGWY